MEQKDQTNKKKTSNNLVEYSRYSNLAFQMAIILILGVFGGIKLDSLIKLDFPVFTVVLSFSAVVLSIYFGIKDFLHNKK